jgi:hypothetical protein
LGVETVYYTLFFPDRIVGFLVESPLQTGGKVFLFYRFFRSCWFEDVRPRGFLGDLKRKSISRGEKRKMEAEARGPCFSGALFFWGLGV